MNKRINSMVFVIARVYSQNHWPDTSEYIT